MTNFITGKRTKWLDCKRTLTNGNKCTHKAYETLNGYCCRCYDYIKLHNYNKEEK